MTHAGRTLGIESADHTFRIYEGDELITETARTTGQPIARFKVRKPERPRASHTHARRWREMEPENSGAPADH